VVMQMAIIDKIYTGTEVEDMSGLDRTYFINDIYNDYKMCKDLRQEKMEAFYLELLIKLIKDYGN